MSSNLEKCTVLQKVIAEYTKCTLLFHHHYLHSEGEKCLCILKAPYPNAFWVRNDFHSFLNAAANWHPHFDPLYIMSLIRSYQ